MIRLNKLTDYAVVLLTAMAARPHAVSSASALAAATHVPEATVGRVLKMLARGRIIRSERGATGGYALARVPEQVSVAEIIAAVEGPVSLVECLDPGESQCGVEAFCQMRGRWEAVNGAIERALRSLTLADMMPNTPFPRGGDGSDGTLAGRQSVEA